MTIRREECLPDGTAATLLNAAEAGSESWWQRIAQTGTPLVEATDGSRLRMSFFWRDPAGDETRSATVRVYADINGVTHHHSLQPQSLQRLPGTDVWHWSTLIESNWRGSYSFIPVSEAQLPPVFSDDPAQQRQQQREWWISLFPLAIADPLNRHPPHLLNPRRPFSAAQMPDAPLRATWLMHDARRRPADPARLQQLSWNSALLGNTRRLWIYTTGEPQPDRPLVLLLDGQNWAESMPLFGVLDSETEQGSLPPACWLFIDVIDMANREKDLPCSAQFWQAVQQELLPLVAEHTPFSAKADRTLVAGQSYGGLAALYAGLRFPQRFGRVLSLSGSFWWPNMLFMTDFARRETHQPGWLTAQLLQGALPASQLTIFLQAGSREADIEFVNQQMYQALRAAGHQVNFQIYAGGHDALCWRSGLLDGLRWLLSDTPASLSCLTGDNHD